MYKYIVIIFSVLSLTSCEDFFSSTLKVDPPEHESQLVLHTFVTSSDTIMRVALGRSKGILEDIDYSELNVNDAELSFYEGENLEFDLFFEQEDESDSYNYLGKPEAVFAEEGKTYTIKVNHPDYGEITATQTMPMAVPISSGKLKEDTGINEYGDRTSQAEIVFDDPSGEENFYELVLIAVDLNNQEFDFYDIYITSLDPNISEGIGQSLLLRDRSFDGKEYKLLIDFDSYHLEQERSVFVMWRTVTEDYYLYAKSLTTFVDGDDFEFFREPVSLHSNITNGLGIFGMRTESIYPLE